jgi:osmotically inducible protein OsmC
MFGKAFLSMMKPDAGEYRGTASNEADHAKAVWRGTGRAGSGNLSTDSGLLAETPYSFKTRFENEKGTNPEELTAAAHAGCFTMALAFGLQGAGYTPTELSTETVVTLDPEGQGFHISRSALTLRAKVPNLDEATFARMAGDAEKNCPVSKVLNAEIPGCAGGALFLISPQ